MRIKLCGLIVWAAMLAAGFVSCQQHDDIPQGVKYPILFDSSDTRATANLDSLEANGFKVYAYFEGAGNSHTFVKDVTYNATQLVWGYEGLEYWIPGATYWFKAFYPTVPSAGTLTVANTSSAQSFKIANFDIRMQEDIMVAETTREGMEVDKSTGAPQTGSVVDLSFKHLLANVIIKIKSEVNDITVQKIVIGGADTNSTYNGNAWELTGNKTSINSEEPYLLTKGKDYEDVTNGGILVIPASSNKSLTIETNNKTYNLTIPNGTWESGKRYSYTLVIKQDNIVFVDGAPYVEEWDSENATGSVIIK